MTTPIQVAGNPERAAKLDPNSGSWLEKLLFNHRLMVLLVCLVASLLLGWQASNLTFNASFEKTLPTQHSFIINYLENKGEIAASGNTVRVVVATNGSSIFEARYLELLQKLTDELYLLPGVDRPRLKSLWTASTRWVAVTEDGLDGGTVIPERYDGSTSSIHQVRSNVERSGEIGQLVAPNFKSSVIVVPLLPFDQNGNTLNYSTLSRSLEELRSKYESEGLTIRINGFAKVVGDLMDGTRQVFAFFAIAAAIAGVMLYRFTGCARSTLLVLACSLTAVVWQLGLLPLLGYPLDPYSVLVPFLVFAIGMSHGAQKMNGIMQDMGRGAHRVDAARLTFRRLFLAGLTALLCDAVGFAVLTVIEIQVIKELAAIASLGVAALIFTNLILLPILLSYVGVSPKAAQASLKLEGLTELESHERPRWLMLSAFTQRRPAAWALAIALILGVAGAFVSTHLKVGDLDPGAPELRVDSRYNRDAAYMTENYGASNDVFVVIVKTPPNRCAGYDAQSRMDKLEWDLRGLDGVEGTSSLSSLSRKIIVLMNEGNSKWFELLPTQSMLNSVTNQVPPDLFNARCDTLSLLVYLKDHKADTLARVVAVTEQFAQVNSTEDVKFLLAAGNAGIEAATNVVVQQASRDMLLLVYAAVALLCMVTFRSWRAVVCALLPLILTSILAEALMVGLGMGVKVATLPVIALGVGIGVDYALYIMSVVLAQLRAGRTLTKAYEVSLLFTGRVVMLTGLTLAAGVGTWVLSPIKFQADMGVLLAFMFLLNMLGALILVPALSFFLLSGRIIPVMDTDPPLSQLLR